MRLHDVRFKTGVEKLRCRQRPEGEHVADAVRRGGGDAVRESETRAQARKEPASRFAGRPGKERRESARGAQHAAAIARPGVGVATRVTRDFAAMDDTIAVARMIAAIGEDGDAALGADKAQTVARQVEIGGDARGQAAAAKRVARHMKARRDLMRGA